MKVTFIIGTRPELIKVAPVIIEIAKEKIDFDVVNTAQHKELLDPYWDSFGIKPTHVLDVMVKGQNLASLSARALFQIQEYIDNVKTKPTIILAQGDTTTVMASAMVSFYNNIKFAHLEAGLRSFDYRNPFPEEFNRKVASITADYHFCPTELSKQNLLNEGIVESKIHVVGNTVVDSLGIILKNGTFTNSDFLNSKLNLVKNYAKTVLITCHRRENQGDNLLQIIDGVLRLAKGEEETIFIWTMHPNPGVKEVIQNSLLIKQENVLFVEPLDYLDLLKILKLSFCAITDSGGIQEEAPSFETPVLVMRDTTERPEAVHAGMAFLTGANSDNIVNSYENLKNNNIKFSSNPYGDGFSSERVVKIITNIL